MIKHLIIGTAILPLALISTSGSARMFGPQPNEQLGMNAFVERFDVDGNGRVTRLEIETVLGQDFVDADLDGSESLSYAELHALEEQRRVERLTEEFTSLDQDQNGVISEQEFVDGHPQDRATAAAIVFSAADLDLSGGVDPSEFEILKEAGRGPWHFANLDLNGDGAISQEEFLSSSSPRGRGFSGRR